MATHSINVNNNKTEQIWPRQDIPETEKNQEWCKKHLNYAIYRYDTRQSNRIARINRLKREHNGAINSNRIKYLTSRYKKKSRTKFIDYRLGYPKIQLILGEWLKRPMNTTVYSTNKSAVTKKFNKFKRMLALSWLKDEINKLKDTAGYDLLQGMEVPDKSDPEALKKINLKSRNEKIMQTGVKRYNKKLDMRTKLSDNFYDILVVSECFSRLYMSEYGKIEFEVFDPRDAVFEEIEGDCFIQKTPYFGRKTRIPISDVLTRYPELSKDDRDKLNEIRKNPSSYLTNQDRIYYYQESSEVMVDVFHLEWKSHRPIFTKLSPDKKNLDNPPFEKELTPEFYEKNVKQIKRDVEKGKYGIKVKWKIEIWEGTKIGHKIYVNCRRRPFRIFDNDDPSNTRYSYSGLLFNTRNGQRISFQDILGDLNFQHAAVMFQINRELSKIKGTVFVYDRALLPKGQTIESVMHGMSEDALIDISSAQEGNQFGRDVLSNLGIQSVNMGDGSVIPILIQMKRDIEDTMDKLSGVNERREGGGVASETATAATQKISASRTITEPMFYFMNRYTENVFNLLLDNLKIVWGVLGIEEAEEILGFEDAQFLKVTKDISNDDYGTFISDGGRELEIRELMRRVAEVSLNAKELRIPDFLEMELEETMGGALEKLKKGWSEIKRIQLLQTQQRDEAKARNTEAQLEAQKEFREDQQSHERDLAYIKSGLKREEKVQESSDQIILDQNKEDTKQQKEIPV